MMIEQVTYYTDQLQEIVERVWINYDCTSSSRYLISLAGVPGAGKTTFANQIAMELSKKVAKTIVLSQDGFHLYRSELEAMPNASEAIRRRGAPFTFNAKAFVKLVSILHDKSIEINAPSFDHKLKDPVENDIMIARDVSIVIIEGNYVSLKDKFWNDISSLVDDTWFIIASEQLVRSRIIRRHLQAGIAKNEQEAIERTDGNDLQNAKYILENSKTTNVLIVTR
ncbi:hypothetical protein KGF56_002103 [Candida oxycetoniae]|uniref:Phosphoribulokinase/uridine kinase domain-containing protein n=1 Tax=Candida oxycetoniae TaxID=497107 RepID=A0AAI9SXX5_9ASCO|nr:uncharacterized protein KGF56_002103 [Candida oxycetoniae]KAI3405147.2 hypothetical protein KGF56_002103 [Candida oxycetoniae]